MLFGKLKLTSKLAVIIGAVLAVIFALLIGVTISTTSTSIQKGIAGELSALARATGTEIQDSFGVVDDTARGIQEYIGRAVYCGDGPERGQKQPRAGGHRRHV